MSPHDFWYGPASLCAAYRESWRVRRDNADTDAWVAGGYVYKALASVLSQALSNGGEQYPERPAHETRESRSSCARRGTSAAFEYMQRFAEAHNRKRAREAGRE